MTKNDAITPAIDPIYDFFGLTLGNIFFLPHFDPKKNAAESQAQTLTINAKVKEMLFIESNWRIGMAVPSKSGL